MGFRNLVARAKVAELVVIRGHMKNRVALPFGRASLSPVGNVGSYPETQNHLIRAVPAHAT